MLSCALSLFGGFQAFPQKMVRRFLFELFIIICFVMMCHGTNCSHIPMHMLCTINSMFAFYCLLEMLDSFSLSTSQPTSFYFDVCGCLQSNCLRQNTWINKHEISYVFLYVSCYLLLLSLIYEWMNGNVFLFCGSSHIRTFILYIQYFYTYICMHVSVEFTRTIRWILNKISKNNKIEFQWNCSLPGHHHGLLSRINIIFITENETRERERKYTIPI